MSSLDHDSFLVSSSFFSFFESQLLRLRDLLYVATLLHDVIGSTGMSSIDSVEDGDFLLLQLCRKALSRSLLH